MPVLFFTLCPSEGIRTLDLTLHMQHDASDHSANGAVPVVIWCVMKVGGYFQLPQLTAMESSDKGKTLSKTKAKDIDVYIYTSICISCTHM